MATLTITLADFQEFGFWTITFSGSGGRGGSGSFGSPFIIEAGDTVSFAGSSTQLTGTIEFTPPSSHFSPSTAASITSGATDNRSVVGSTSAAVNFNFSRAGAFDQAIYFQRNASVDDVPDQFTFTDVDPVDLNEIVISAPITIAGMGSGVTATASVSNGLQSRNGEAFTSDDRLVDNGDEIRLRHQAQSTFNSSKTTTLTVSGISDGFTSTTLDEDTTPDQFTFTDKTGQALSTQIPSDPITVAGINSGAAISVTGGFYSINGGSYVSGAGTVQNGDQVRANVLSSSSNSTTTSCTVTIGGVSDDFDVTTQAPAPDTTPNQFNFTNKTEQPIAVNVDSDPVTITGINTASPISVSGGSYKINSGSFTTAAGNVNNNDQVTARVLSSSSYQTSTSCTVTVGGVSDDFIVTTSAEDITPDEFTFNPVGNVTAGSTQTSNLVTISGLGVSTTVSVTGGTYSKNGGGYTSANGTVTNGNTFRVRGVASGTAGGTTSVVLTVGNGQSTFVITTAGTAVRYGLQTFDSSGNLKLTVTDRTAFVLERRLFQNVGANGGTQTVNYTNNVLSASFLSGYQQLGIPKDIDITYGNNSVTVQNNTPTLVSVSAIIISGG